MAHDIQKKIIDTPFGEVQGWSAGLDEQGNYHVACNTAREETRDIVSIEINNFDRKTGYKLPKKGKMKLLSPYKIGYRRTWHKLPRRLKKALPLLTLGLYGNMSKVIKKSTEKRPVFCWIVEDTTEGRPIAWCTLHRRWTRYEFNVYVHSDHRSQGLGYALFQMAEKYCSRIGANIVVCPHDMRSAKFYKRVVDNASTVYDADDGRRVTAEDLHDNYLHRLSRAGNLKNLSSLLEIGRKRDIT